MAAYASSNTASGTGSAVVTKPSGLAAGDLMVAFVGIRGTNYESGSASTPSGWTLIQNSGDATVNVYAFAKIADSSDAAATNFTFSHSNGSGRISAVMFRITGTFASTANIYKSVVNSGTENSSGVFDFATGVTPDVASSLLLMGVNGYATTSFNASDATAYALQTSNPTWTERSDVNYGSDNRHRLSSATATRTETTDTGYYRITYTLSGEDSQIAYGILLAINDTLNGTATPAVISLVGSVQAPTPTGDANVSVGVQSVVSSVPSTTAAASSPLWANTDKPSSPTYTNPDKP